MVLGPRFLIEAGFIIAVAVVAGIERLGTWTIIAVVAASWLVVAAVELALWWRNSTGRGLTPQGSDPSSSADWKPEPEPEPEPEPVTLQPEPPPAPAPPLIAAPPPPPEPEVAYTPRNNAPPREWNLWELERLARDHVDDDVAKNEERAYLLMYLREFAGPDGTLPADFDGLVRDAFSDLVRAPAR